MHIILDRDPTISEDTLYAQHWAFFLANYATPALEASFLHLKPVCRNRNRCIEALKHEWRNFHIQEIVFGTAVADIAARTPCQDLACVC